MNHDDDLFSLGAFYDRLDSFSGFSLKNQMDIISSTNQSFKKNKEQMDSSLSKHMDEIPPSSESDSIPMKLTKKGNNKRKDISIPEKPPPSFEPMDNKTLDIRSKAKPKKKRRKRNSDIDEAMEAIEAEFQNNMEENANRVPIRNPITYVPLSKIHTNNNEYENEDIYSSCEEIDPMNDHRFKRKKIEEKKQENQASKLISIFKGKNMAGLILDESKDKPSDSSSSSSGSSSSSSSSENESDSDCGMSLSGSDRNDSGSEKSSSSSLSASDDLSRMFQSIKSYYDLARSEKKESEICFCCMFGSSQDPAIDGTALNELMDLIRQNYGISGNRFVARLAHCYFMNHIYIPLKLDGKDIPLCKSIDFLRHIEGHSNDPVIHLGQTIMKYKKVNSILKNMLFMVKRDESGMEYFTWDRNTLRYILETDKQIIALYKTNPKDMLFYNESFRIDTSVSGKFFNFHKNIVFHK